MRTTGYSNEEALLEISKKRRPELFDAVHYMIIEKFNEVPLLVNFLAGALPNGKVTDETAIGYVRDTTIEYLGRPGRYKVRFKSR